MTVTEKMVHCGDPRKSWEKLQGCLDAYVVDLTSGEKRLLKLLQFRCLNSM